MIDSWFLWNSSLLSIGLTRKPRNLHWAAIIYPPNRLFLNSFSIYIFFAILEHVNHKIFAFNGRIEFFIELNEDYELLGKANIVLEYFLACNIKRKTTRSQRSYKYWIQFRNYSILWQSSPTKDYLQIFAARHTWFLIPRLLLTSNWPRTRHRPFRMVNHCPELREIFRNLPIFHSCKPEFPIFWGRTIAKAD